jgi:feruloyl esterase
VVVLLAACGGGERPTASTGAENQKASDHTASTEQAGCNPEMAGKAVAGDNDTTVLLVKEFRQGDPLLLSGTPTDSTPKAANDLCMVKLNVGPGNPGPSEAPSTSPGIGIEVWLPSPANWNERLHVLGGGGWAGGVHGSTSQVSSVQAAGVAGTEGAVSATTDTGHADTSGGGSFAMKPDGTINAALWRDFAWRGIHEMAVKSKALAATYYGRPAKYSYWEGGSTGGRP